MQVLKCFLILPGILLLQLSLKAQQYLLVLNKADNSLSVLDPIELQQLFMVPTGESPHELAVYPEKKWAIVANYGNQQPGNSLSIIDLNQRKEIKRVDLGPILKPHGLELKEQAVYFTAERSRLVGRFDLSKMSVNWLQGTGQNGTHLLVLHPSRPYVYTSNRVSNTITRIRIDAPDLPEAIQQAAAGLKPEGIDIRKDGKELWVGSNETGTITVFDTETLQQMHEISTGGTPIRIKFTPDNKWVLVSDAKNAALLLLDAGSRQLKAQLNPGGIPMGIILSEDSKTAYVAIGSTNEVIKLSIPELKIIARARVGK
ncbi:beta-propeller fold lactonase family protein [Flavihumibacter sp. CACIAM 22H1]|uniref:YncE family protein n=1 Tax=Flavihumibacter sp. CACIAM 22H1 TaxID=1812911 RepID=UPI0007A9343C|nr:beta-propeller fold lactonase family protein [Flavihumibacter sp. CACIAM 22H1]KYP13114.1 MAG: hypothetical protein A1D16_05765 [Flavihumibacter sp. CACIAM 22H1]